MIPKILHFIWVGDETKRPDNCIATWRDQHPGWEVRVWGNAEFERGPWINQLHMRAMWNCEFNGVADLMRWEILLKHGGIVLDADSICLQPLDEELLEGPAFASWESEIARPGLIAAGYFGAEPDNPFVRQIILEIHAKPTVTHDKAWKTVGPLIMTEVYRKYAYTPLRIYPSHYFIPRHHTGLTYQGTGKVYADQLWGTTHAGYDQIHRLQLPGAPPPAAPPAPPPAAVAAPAPAAGPLVATSPLERQHAPYFVQHVPVDDSLIGLQRIDVFRQVCAGKRVLHVGCADWPITDTKNSLHLALEPHCAALDGFDIHEDALAQLAPLTKGRLFSDFAAITDRYDVVLVPEVMEHVPDVPGFLAQLESLDAEAYYVSVPDAFQCRGRHFDYVAQSQTFVEVVHPDHNVWYTPYTFANSIRKYSRFNLDHMWFFNRISLLARLSRPRQAMAA